MSLTMESGAMSHHAKGGIAALTMIALGVVYGDIGTSPLYAFQVAMAAAGSTSPATVLGVTGLILYAILFVVAFKYVMVVLKADNHGEGGILSLLALVKRRKYSRGLKVPGIVFLAILGAAFIYGDGSITPAISVLSALEGLGVAIPSVHNIILPATVVVLLALFLVQRRGTGAVGRIFGPVMLGWFGAIGALGLFNVLKQPMILFAFSPHYVMELLSHNPATSAGIFGAIFLALTGAEALFADMGHVGGAKVIRKAWFTIVLPALILNYLGQGANTIAHPEAAASPFWLSIPHFLMFPMVALATLATIIASQALITGAFSLTRQAMQMSLLPRMRTVQTSHDEHGQIYVPVINWMLMVGAITVAIAFRTSDALAAAYGVAVSGTMLITTILLYRVMVEHWRWNLILATLLTFVFGVIDLGFLASNTMKIFEGGWFPLIVGGAIAFVMISWAMGAAEVKRRLTEMAVPLDDFISSIDNGHIARVPGTAVWLTKVSSGITPTLQHHVQHVKAIHEQVILLTIEVARVPVVKDHDGLHVEDLGHGFKRVIVRTGFMQRPCVATALRWLSMRGEADLDRADIHCFVGHEIPARKADKSRLCFASWAAFSLLGKLSGKAADYFRIPHENVEEIGIRVEI